MTRDLLLSRKLAINTIILVQKPYMERRAYATVCKQWQEVDVVAVASPRLRFNEYITPQLTATLVWTMRTTMCTGDAHMAPGHQRNGGRPAAYH
jgi:uncharacterized SAM-binding protein YcdF (DUF218 family)